MPRVQVRSELEASVDQHALSIEERLRAITESLQLLRQRSGEVGRGRACACA